MECWSGLPPRRLSLSDGKLQSSEKVAILKGILQQMGFTDNRIWLKWISASEGKLFADTVTKMVEELKRWVQIQ